MQKTVIHRFILLALFSFLYTHIIGQKNEHRLKIDTTYNAKQYIEYLLGDENIKINNIKLRGLPSSIAKFEIDTSILGFQKGVVLSTGNTNSIPGENKTPGTSGLAWDNKYKFRSDRDLNLLAKGRVCDQIVLEFDFIPLENHLVFNYFFASEEYKEYVGSRFNDVFGFIITGDNNFRKNIATISSQNLPVTINNINHIKNKELFINNTCFENYKLKKEIDETEPRKPFFKSFFEKLFGSKNKDFVIDPVQRKALNNFLFNQFEFDGLTKPLEASIFLEPYKVYHMKIAIGDVGDAMFDSGVFLEKGSMKSTKNKNAPGFKEYADRRNEVDFEALFKYKEINPIKIDSPPQIPEEFEITNINFETNKHQIHDSDEIKIRHLALFLQKNQNYRVHLLGYTDNVGSLEHNQKLSERRAKTVRSILIKNGISEERINFIGNNYENPLETNEFEFGRKKNRRVEIVVLE